MGVIETIQAASPIAAGMLIASVWQGLLLTAAVWAALKLAPKTTAAVRFFAWSAVFAAVALLPLFSLATHSDGAGVATPANAVGHAALELGSRWALGIVAVWLALSAVRFAFLLRNGFRLRGLWKRATPVDMALPCETGFRPAQLCSSADVDQPCVIGFCSPRVLVPEWLLAKADPAELRQILLHETAHLQRFDDWTNLAQKLALALFPLNPALLWADSRLSSEREWACDESVLRATRAPREYAACLANLAEQRMLRRAASLSLGAWERRSELARRIHNILRSNPARNSVKGRAVMAGFMLATAGGALILGRSSDLVSFTAPEHVEAASTVSGPVAPRSLYRDVVYREPAERAAVPPTKSTAKPALRRRIARPSRSAPLQAASAIPGGATFVVVTRWSDASGQGESLTLIQRVRATPVDMPAGVVAFPRAAWYFIQL